MKILHLLFFFLVKIPIFGQEEMFIPDMEIKATDKNIRYNKDEILQSVKQTNLKGKSLKIIGYPNMSECGGGVKGYYDKGELKIIESVYGAEFGFQGLTVYFKDSSIVKITRKEAKPDYDAYEKSYPNKKEIDPDLLKYINTEITILLTETPQITYRLNGSIVKNTYRNKDLSQDLNCIRTMMLELKTVTEL